MQIKLFNTLTRTKELFKPIKQSYVGIYCCGPTVYNFVHVGNLRTFIFEDLLRRMFIFNKYKVNFVRNITDVGHLTSDADEGEDKILKEARKQNKTAYEIAEFYTQAFLKDIEKLNISLPTTLCKATEHIKDMIEMIKKLETNNLTYQAGGNIYFDTSKFKDYGKMANLKLEDLEAGARIEVDPNKKNPRDFVLWFTKSKFGDQEMQWESPWGKGYPGWHIECSAMSTKYLGENFDIHCGGIDLMPVHHTNEIAQSEGTTNKKWVNYWLHGEFLVLDKEKMSKSKGTFITLKSLIDESIDPLVYRYFCLNAHYRTPLTFSMEGIKAAQNSYNNLKSKIIELKNNKNDTKGNIHNYEEEFHQAINDDLNIPIALATLWKALKDNNLGSKEKLQLVENFDQILGLKLMASKEEVIEIPENIILLAKQRQSARKAKDYAKSDELRSQIEEKGFLIEDTKEGYKIKKKNNI